MKIKIFTLGFSENAGGFDDQPVQDFIADKEVMECSEHFYVYEKTPYLTLVLSYRDISRDEKRKLHKKQDPRNELDATEKKAYDALRTWRAERAKQDGIPPYMIANNRQVAGMIKQKAGTKTDLLKIGGIGEAKIAQYGEEILKLLDHHLSTETTENTETENRADQ